MAGKAGKGMGRSLAPGRSAGMRLFQILYLGAAGLYILAILFWGRHDMGRVHREYRQVSERLAGGYAQELADREVAAGCRQAVGGVSVPAYGDCLRSSAPLVQKRAAVITAELLASRQQVLKKLAIFYLLVSLLLIIAPLSLLYIILLSLLYLLSKLRYPQD